MPEPHGGFIRYELMAADPAAAAGRAAGGGGAIVRGPWDVQGGDRIVPASDPQGATFSTVGKGKG